MKVKDLIEELKKQAPEKEVMIQQGEEYDYMVVYSVKEKEMELDNYDSVKKVNVVTIEYS